MKTAFGIILLVLVGANQAQDSEYCPSTGTKPYDYAQALCLSAMFYEAQRSGKLPYTQRVTWRRDAALHDGDDVGLDLTGGYFDAGDYVKFNFPMAYTVTALAWGIIAYPDGMEQSGQTEYVREAVKWGSDYFLKCHTGPTELYGQVGDPALDHAYWGRPEELDMERPAYKITAQAPGTDLAGETCAALAATSVVFRDIDSDYADECLAAAIELCAFSDQYRELYHISIDKANGFYSSYSYEDELPWGHVWLYVATEEEEYLTMAKGYIDEFGLMEMDTLNVDWDDKKAAVYAMMAEYDGGAEYMDRLEEYVERMMGYQHTPKGMVYVEQWGSLREACNCAFIALRAASLGLQPSKFNDWAQQQIDYALGSTGRSLVVGFGVNPPTHPHHEAASCPDIPDTCDWSDYQTTDPNPQILYGALVGGPDANDGYVDNRDDYVHNEVACDYNGLYTGALARMVELH